VTRSGADGMTSEAWRISWKPGRQHMFITDVMSITKWMQEVHCEATEPIEDCAQIPLPHCGRGRGPLREQWEGEGGGELESTATASLKQVAEAFCASQTLTRLAALTTLSRNAGEG
jgi:hypothetical protein